MKKFFMTLQILMFVLSACNVATPIPATPVPSLTSTVPIPTATSTEIPSPTLVFDKNKIDMLVVSEGFSISVPFPLIYQNQKNIVLIATEDKSLSISFVGDTYDGTQPLVDVIDRYLNSLEKRGATFFRGESVSIQVDGEDGVSMDLSGKLNDIDVLGRAIAVSPRSDLVLFGIALSKVDSDNSIWESEHSAIFQSLLDGIKFTDVNASCQISVD